MAQSEKVFRETLCESRSYSVETMDPTGARTIDELRRQVKELKAQYEGEKVKLRQTQRDQDKKLQQLRDEEAMRLDTALEACSIRKEQEKLNELRKLEERLGKQRDQDLRILRKEKMEELNKSLRKWQLEKSEAVRLAAEVERRRSSMEFQAQYNEEEAQSREAKLTREVFVLGEQNEALEEQVKNLSKLNRAQIDQMRRLKMEADIKVDSVIKQHKVEASREMAQLKLAEQIIADKDHHLQHSEYRADVAQLEKEALEEELATMRSRHSTSLTSTNHDTSLHDTPGGTPNRKTGLLQRRVEDLENQLKKLEEEKATLKQDNAALRKRLVHDEDDKKGGGAGGKAALEDKIKVLRKKNSELTTLTKQLDDMLKAQKLEFDQMLKSRGSSVDGENVKKLLARQHAKDISEYTKQIMAKDKELTMLKKKLGKLEVAAVSRSEPSPELEKKMKLMVMNGLQMEKVMAKLYSRLPDVVDTENLSHRDLNSDSKKMEELASENDSLRGELQSLQLQVASLKESPAVVSTGISEQEASSRIAVLEQENKGLSAKNERLTELSRSTAQLEARNGELQETVDQLEESNSKLEQTSHKLRQELEISDMAVKELQGSQDSMAELEKEVASLKDELRLKEERLMVQKREMAETNNQVTGHQVIITTLQDKLEQTELKCSEREQQNSSLQTALDKAREELETLAHTSSCHSMGTQVDLPSSNTVSQDASSKPHSTESLSHAPLKPARGSAPVHTGQQQLTQSLPLATEADASFVTPTSAAALSRARANIGTVSRQSAAKDRVRSPKRRSLRSLSPRTSSGDLQDSSLDHEMKAAGFDFTESGDSSEGAGFSESIMDSTAELETDSSPHKAKEGDDPPRPTLAWEETAKKEEAGSGEANDVVFDEGSLRGTDQAQATNEVSGEEGKGGASGGIEEEDGQAQLNRLLSGDGARDNGLDTTNEYSYGSDEELPPSSEVKATYEPPESEGSPAFSDGDKVGIYIAKYTYVPSEMSPNENYDLELPLMAGDYLYVFGEMDNDGFYHGQLLSGKSGMVPSNFIDRVMDEEEAHKPPAAPHLHDIQEVDEPSSSSGRGIPPPTGLSLERQFVEGDQYSVAIKWEVPCHLPEGVTGYNIYVNGEFNYDVEGSDQTSVLLTGIPRKQLVKISVRTVTDEGESANPQKLIILNPQYPDSPTNVMVTRSSAPTCLMVQWTPSQPLKEGNPISGYIVCLNKNPIVEVAANNAPVTTVCAQIFPSDVKKFKVKLVKDKVVSLTVHARSNNYMSTPSQPVVVSQDDLVHIYEGAESEGTSSEASLSSSEEEEVDKVGGFDSVRTSMNGKTGKEVQANEVEIITVETNGLEDGNGPHNANHDAARFYRAMACYNPHLQSPNKDSAEEELGFLADDIIIGLAEVDEDGFLMGELGGKTGYVPSNLVEEIVDDEELNQIRSILREKGTLPRALGENCDVNGSGLRRDGGDSVIRTMVAEYDYDPDRDSPNDSSEVELALTQGQLITVLGYADEDGFVKAEIDGKKGIVPGNYLREAHTPLKNSEVEVFAADDEDMKQADAIIGRTQTSNLRNQKTDEDQTTLTTSTTSSKRKGGVLSRGKNLFTRAKKGGQ